MHVYMYVYLYALIFFLIIVILYTFRLPGHQIQESKNLSCKVTGMLTLELHTFPGTDSHQISVALQLGRLSTTEACQSR